MANALSTNGTQVGITNDYQVLEVRATAKATGRTLDPGPEYNFSIFINAPPDVLSSIQQVTYHFGHPTFLQQDYVSTNSQDNFKEDIRGGVACQT
jgi:pYEATS domain-containing protein involved in immunity